MDGWMDDDPPVMLPGSLASMRPLVLHSPRPAGLSTRLSRRDTLLAAGKRHVEGS